MKQVLIRAGKVVVADVPAPRAAPGTVLVGVAASCISAGTEHAGIDAQRQPLVRRALEHPERVKAVVDLALQRGVAGAISAVRGELNAGAPTGYSVAGTVVEVGAGVADLAVGDRVACAGAGLASHAELVAVPRNLVARVPGGLSFDEASTVTLGAIALHGVRRAAPTLGEWFVVVGLGLLGQLTVQLLRAHGCRVAGLDLSRERVALALALGMDAALAADEADPVAAVKRLTDGQGADGVILTAATSSDDLLASAFRMCRRKGRVVVVGDVGLGMRREDIYPREIEFFISTSYGPGRYDPQYEREGHDYPIGYVRWTENRNMVEYLRLLAEGRVRLGPLLQGTFPVERAPEAFAAAAAGAAQPIVLLSYPGVLDAADAAAPPRRRVDLRPAPARTGSGRTRIALVGAGDFARGVHLPNLQKLSSAFELRAVMSRSGPGALRAAEQFGAAYATTDYDAVLADDAVDAVIICTRHDSHAAMALAALRAGKHVLLEKPLALTPEELEELERFFADEAEARRAPPVLLTGFNRRFSPHARRLRELLQGRGAPAMLDYRMNAGHIPLDHWVHGPQGGGRNIGEACHVYDLLGYLVGEPVETVQALSIRPGTGHLARNDNFVATLRFRDGSLASLTYTALGNRDFPKERLDVFCDGVVGELDDYRGLRFHGRGGGLKTRRQDKGHLAELEAFGRAVREGGEWPIPLWQQVQATRIALRVEQLLGRSPAEAGS